MDFPDFRPSVLLGSRQRTTAHGSTGGSSCCCTKIIRNKELTSACNPNNDVDFPRWHPDQQRHRFNASGRIPATVTPLRRRRRRSFPSPNGAVAKAAVVLFVTVSSFCLVSPTVGLVIEEPFFATFDHVAAAFGPNVLSVEPPVESRPLVKARPRDGCSPLLTSMDNRAIALVERGSCNFTQKVLNAQDAGASAVIVSDTPTTEKWEMVMYGDKENAKGIEIPAVLVSHATGDRLWNNRSWIPGTGRLRASLGAAGHIELDTRRAGAVEMVGIYLLLSVLLMAFSGVCGLLFALALTWYQRGYRARAMRKLKCFTFRRKYPPPSGTPVDANQITDSSRSDDRRSSETKAGRGGSAAVAVTVVDQHARPSSCNTGGTASAGPPSQRRGHPDKCVNGDCENCGSGSGEGGRGKGAGAGVGDGGKSVITKSPTFGGRSSSSGNGDMRAEDDDLCAICLETFEDGESLTGLPCRHSFHAECIRPWLSGKSALCPMCKADAFGKGGLLSAAAPRLEAAFAELAALCTENLAVLGLFFLASVACGVIAAQLSLHG